VARVPGGSEPATGRHRDLEHAETAWGRSTPQSLLTVGDLRKAAGRLPLALALAGRAVRDPRTFGITAVAIRRHRALQKPLELFEYLRFLRGRHTVRCLEIGSLWGGTFFAHCAVTSPSGHVMAVDAFPDESGDVMAARFRRLARGTQRVTCIWRDSHAKATASEVARALDGQPLDVLFLDGDHSSEGAARDYEMYAPLVRPGGVIALHDIDSTSEGSGMPMLWRSLRDRHESVEFVDRVHPPHGLGIGAIVKG